MLMIRFQRIGRTNDPAFRIVVLEKERAAKSGRITEQLGTYNPRSKAMTLNEGKVKEWISKGAQPTGSIHNLLVSKGVLSGKKINVLPRKKPIAKESTGEVAAAVAAPAATAAPAVETTPEAPSVEAAPPSETAATSTDATAGADASSTN